MTRTLPIPATPRGRTTTAERTSTSPAAEAGPQTPPTAALTVTPTSGNAPLSVTADASASTAGSSPISSYSFDFGDGTIVGPQSSATANHTYQSAGTYKVTVTVTDGNNADLDGQPDRHRHRRLE